MKRKEKKSQKREKNILLSVFTPKKKNQCSTPALKWFWCLQFVLTSISPQTQQWGRFSSPNPAPDRAKVHPYCYFFNNTNH